jgi:hypothetical protein
MLKGKEVEAGLSKESIEGNVVAKKPTQQGRLGQNTTQ